jgi:hypothetical protein
MRRFLTWLRRTPKTTVWADDDETIAWRRDSFFELMEALERPPSLEEWTRFLYAGGAERGN